MQRILIGLCLMMLYTNMAFALSLRDAKSGGLVGERNDGYVGYVVTAPSAEVRQLVKNVNNKRKSKFANTAKNNQLKTEQVARRFYQRAVQATASGHYYQDAGGGWAKK